MPEKPSDTFFVVHEVRATGPHPDVIVYEDHVVIYPGYMENLQFVKLVGASPPPAKPCLPWKNSATCFRLGSSPFVARRSRTRRVRPAMTRPYRDFHPVSARLMAEACRDIRGPDGRVG